MFAIGAMLCWGVGDFLIQKSTRHIGIVNALFWIALFGSVSLFPFVAGDIRALNIHDIVLLTTAGVVTFVTSLFEFEAFKDGKLSIVEPVMASELLITIGLSIGIAHEQLTIIQAIAIGTILTGVLLAVTRAPKELWMHRHRWLERGVIYACLGAIGLGLTNFIMGIASQQTSALMTVWWTWTVLAILTAIPLVRERNMHLVRDLRVHGRLIIAMAMLDTAAWIFFSIATTTIYISITNAISEGYIVLAALLGIVITHERLRTHQKVGVAVALAGVLYLASIS